MQTDIELALKNRSKLLREMDALDMALNELHGTLQSLTPDVKVHAMSVELWIKYREIETLIKEKAIEHDAILKKVTDIESQYGINASEPY
jgi:hypothetical protein